MFAKRLTLCLALLAAMAGQCHAEPSANREQTAFAAYLKACFDTHSAYDAVVAAAAENGWGTIDPKEARVVVTDLDAKQTAWKADSAADAPVIFAVKFSNPAHSPYCQVSGFDMNPDAIGQAFVQDSRFEQATPSLPSLLVMRSGGESVSIMNYALSSDEQAAGHTSFVIISGQ